jgi:hypothetical protein
MSDKQFVDVPYLRQLSGRLQRAADDLRSEMTRFASGTGHDSLDYGILDSAQDARRSYVSTHQVVLAQLYAAADGLDDKAARLAAVAALHARADDDAGRVAQRLQHAV